MSSVDPDARPEPRTIQRAETEPRPAYIIVTIEAPSRRRDQQIRLVHEARVEDYDPEHQTPLSYALAAVEDPAIRPYLLDLRDEDEYRGQDFYVEISSDGTCVFDGPGRDALDSIESAFGAELRALVNP